MANRTMAAKSLKLKRQKRAWAKPYSSPSLHTPNRGVLQEYKLRAVMLGVPEYEVDDWIRKLYGRDPFTGTPAGRAEVVQLMKELKLVVPQLLFFELIDNSYQRALCWYNTDKTCWVITHTDKRRAQFRRSIEYGSKARALKLYYQDRLTWVVQSVTNPVHSG